MITRADELEDCLTSHIYLTIFRWHTLIFGLPIFAFACFLTYKEGEENGIKQKILVPFTMVFGYSGSDKIPRVLSSCVVLTSFIVPLSLALWANTHPSPNFLVEDIG